MWRQYEYYLTDRVQFVGSTTWLLYGLIPATGEPLRSTDAYSVESVEELIMTVLSTPMIAREDIHMRDYRKGEPFLMSKVTKHRSQKSFGKNSVSFSAVQDYHTKEWAVYRMIGTAGMLWEDDPRPSGKVSLPATATDAEVAATLLKMVIEARDHWDEFKQR
jgi:hypothetical protein